MKLSSRRDVPKLAVGLALYGLCPGYAHRLIGRSFQQGELSGFRRWLFGAIQTRVFAEYYEPKTSSERREALKRLYQDGDSGVEWAKEYAASGFPDETTEYIPLWKAFDACLAEGGVKKVHQVAVCSGREVAYYAQRYPDIEFVGSDMAQSIVDYCRDTWSHVPNLSFVVAELDKLDEIEPSTLEADLICASGGLQYLDEPVLRQFFRKIKPLCSRLMFNQPLSIEFLMDKYKSSQMRGGFKWNHPYTEFLRQDGWSDVSYEVGFIEEAYWAKSVSVYAHSGSGDRT